MAPAPSPTPTAAQPFGRAETVAFLVLVVGLLVSLVWTVHPWYDPTNDGAMYVLTGRSIVAGEGYSMLEQPFRIRPPGFSYLIAPLLAWRGTEFQALNLFVSLWGVAGCVLLYLWARTRIAWRLAWLLAVVVWCNPGYQLLCNQVMSDVPGTTLLFACLLLERWAQRRPGMRRDLLLGAVVAATAYVRSINLLLVPAILGVRLLRRFAGNAEERAETWRLLGGRAGALVLGAFLVQLPWSLRNAAVAPEPPADQTLLYSYSTGFWNEDMGDPDSRRLSVGEVLARFPKRGGQALGVLGNRMRERAGGREGDEPFAFLFLGSVLFVFVKRRESSELFVLGSMGVISVYFGFAPRLLLPLLVLALAATVEALGDLGRLCARGAPEPRRKLAGELLAGAALVALLVLDFAPRKGWDEIEEQHDRLQAITAGFARELGPESRLASNRSWHYAVLLERPVYALEFVVKRNLDRVRNVVDVESIEELLDRYEIDRVLLSPKWTKDRELLPYFEGRYGPTLDPTSRVYRVR